MAKIREILELKLDEISVNPNQPRKVFDADALFDLADSIKKYGVMQPIAVRRLSGGKFELIAGERRLRASALAGKAYIPAVVAEEVDDRDSAILALIENLQRENLNFFEEAEAFASLLKNSPLTQESLARSVGKSQSAVANKLRVLKLPDGVKKILLESSLSERHARALLALPDDEAKLDAAKKIAADGLTVKQAEKLIENALRESRAQRRRGKVKAYIRDVRLFTNTIRQAVEMMNDGGISTLCDIEDKDDGCVISISVTY